MTALTKYYPFVLFLLLSCSGNRNKKQFEAELQSINLSRGDIALCGAANGQFGKVVFNAECSENVRDTLNLAVALLHSFEYTDAEKVFAKVIDRDPNCIMAYWGAAMCNFHPLWAPPSQAELNKGKQIITLARSLKSKSARESDYLEAIATIYDQWDTLDHHTRTVKYEKASKKLYEKYPEDTEAAIFYALALRTTANPADKSFHNQKIAGEILNKVFETEPNHPGIAHYIIHNYDYPELAELALPAARKYATIASASAHAQHMPSHIFTRLGFWNESIQSNLNSISSAKCYAENMGIKGHWDEELHGMDYLLYAYLQEAKDDNAQEQIEYLKTIKDVFPVDFKDAYTFSAMPARFALERKDWKQAAELQLNPAQFPWDKFLWEKGNIVFARLLGAVHIHNSAGAQKELMELKSLYQKLSAAKEVHKANLVMIQIKMSEAWIDLEAGQKVKALSLLNEAADMEDSTDKDPVTPGEVIPARELLGDMYLEAGDATKALEAYESDLKRHPNRFNGLFGAGRAAAKLGNKVSAKLFYKQLLAVSQGSPGKRPEQLTAELYLKK